MLKPKIQKRLQPGVTYDGTIFVVLENNKYVSIKYLILDTKYAQLVTQSGAS